MRWIVLVLALGLGGCAGAAEWSKDGASPSVAAQDLADCHSDAQAANMKDTNIQTDIMATRQRDWQNTGALGTKQATFAAENQNQTHDYVWRCMIAKGYAPGS